MKHSGKAKSLLSERVGRRSLRKVEPAQGSWRRRNNFVRRRLD
jgi:hypothetical protein